MKVSEVLARIDKNKGSHEFIPTGFPSLDVLLDGGFLKKEMVTIGGATGVGKSYLATHFADQAVSAGFRTGYISLEISNDLILARLIGMRSNTKSSHILYDRVPQERTLEYKKSRAEMFALENTLEMFEDEYEFTALQKIINEGHFEFVIIDFMQNIIDDSAAEYERLSRTAIKLQRLAKTANCCILVLSQLSNAVVNAKPNERPFEYKGSGSIATVTDLGFYFLKEVVYEDDLLGDKKETKDPNFTKYTLSLIKNRRGPSGVDTPLVANWPGGALKQL